MNLKENFSAVDELLRVLRIEAQAIEAAVERFSQDSRQALAWEKAVSLCEQSLKKSGKIVIFGVGKSGKIAQKIAATLCSTGSLALFIHPTEGLHGDLGILSANDSCLAISFTGNTQEVLKLLPIIRQRGLSLIGLGGNSNSQLARQSDVWIDAQVAVEACPHNLAPTASTTLTLAIGDALAMTLMGLRKFQPEEFVKNHPGGSLGLKLSLRVSDLMHKEKALARVDLSSGMDEVVSLANEKKLGAVLVLEHGKLLGLITDGDIRRSLKIGEGFFKMTAGQIMNPHPTSVLPEEMAIRALELMEKRSSQISVLPVIDSHQLCVGLIRLHDLVQAF